MRIKSLIISVIAGIVMLFMFLTSNLFYFYTVGGINVIRIFFISMWLILIGIITYLIYKGLSIGEEKGYL